MNDKVFVKEPYKILKGTALFKDGSVDEIKNVEVYSKINVDPWVEQLQAENEKLKSELEKVKNIVGCKIRLVLRPKYLMDILSIREWNDFVTSYEKDDNVTIHDNMDKYIAFDTTLGNIVNNHSLLDLRFVSQDSVPKEEK